jgi:hypothetical protein
MFAGLAECCAAHYSWNSDECNGVVAGPTNKYFPNWGGSPNVCLLDDGSNTVPDGAPMFAGLADCCALHYSWNSNECNGVVTTEAPPSALYFPDWDGENLTCLQDDGSNVVPDYMKSNPTAYMHPSGEECCQIRYSWRKDDCIANLL